MTFFSLSLFGLAAMAFTPLHSLAINICYLRKVMMFPSGRVGPFIRAVVCCAPFLYTKQRRRSPPHCASECLSFWCAVVSCSNSAVPIILPLSSVLCLCARRMVLVAHLYQAHTHTQAVRMKHLEPWTGGYRVTMTMVAKLLSSCVV